MNNRSKTALILHGDPALRRTMAHTLERLGYRTELARDAAGVRAAADGRPADLLLFDPRLADQAREQPLRTELERHVAEKERLVESLSERTALLDRLSRIQQSISRRADSEEVLDAIVEGAHELLDVERSTIQLVDPSEPGQLVTVAACGFDDVPPEAIRRTPVDQGANGAAVRTEELVAVDDYQQYANAVPGARAAGVKVAMAAPVHDSGAVVGALLVCSHERSRSFSECEQEILARFAEHASLAITDARTVERMHNAYHDRVTGLPGRVRFMELVGEAVAIDPGRTRSVLLIDIVRFRGVNETFGHAVGDAVLVEFAERVKSIVQADDVLAHFGGGDFGVLLGSDDAPRSASDVAEAILESLRHPLDVDGREIAVAAAIGIAEGPGPGEELVRNADVAMFRTRQESRSGGYKRFESGMRATLLQTLQLESDLETAVAERQFRVHYQPIIALDRRELVGLEALVRWEHPTRGLIPPLAFVPLAEEIGVIHKITDFVLASACADAASWQAHYPCDPPLFVSVNASAHDLQRPEFLTDVSRALHDSGIAPETLLLELTETILVRDAERVITRMEALNRMGVRVAMDDFGTGYSSLHYLARLPLDVLKIARPFIDGLGTNREQTALVRTIMQLAEGLGLDVVAEGIEKLRQLGELHRLGCSMGQGYLFSVPIPAEGVIPLLSRASSNYGRLGAGASEDFALPPKAQPRTTSRYDRRPPTNARP